MNEEQNMRKLSIGILMLTVMVIIAPTTSLVQAEQNQNSTESNTAMTNSTISEKVGQIDVKMSEQEAKMKAKMAENEAKMNEKMTEKTEKIKEKMSEKEIQPPNEPQPPKTSGT